MNQTSEQEILELCIKAHNLLKIGNVTTAREAHTLTSVLKSFEGCRLIIVENTLRAISLEQELKFYLDNAATVQTFPDWETLPYDNFSPHQDLVSSRLTILNQLSQATAGIYIVAIDTLLHRLCPKEYIEANSFVLAIKDSFNIEQMALRLERSNYRRVPEVMTHGEYSVRGSLIDVYPMGASHPFRLDIYDNAIDSIRMFEVDSQRSLHKLNQILILPAREFPLNDSAKERFNANWQKTFKSLPSNCVLFNDVQELRMSPGLEYYLPLFFETTTCLLDYLPKHSLIVQMGNIKEAADKFWQELNVRYAEYQGDLTRPLLDPKCLFLSTDELLHSCKDYTLAKLQASPFKPAVNALNLKLGSLPPLESHHSLDLLVQYSKSSSERILFCVDSAGRLNLYLDILARQDIQAVQCKSWDEFVQSSAPFVISLGRLEAGFALPDEKLSIITELELTGQKATLLRSKSVSVNPDLKIANLDEINLGAAVVHIEHGIGRYLGLHTLALNGVEEEFVTLEYDAGDKLYVPIHALHLISRYTNGDAQDINLTRLGGEQWFKAKKRAMASVHDVAAELLEVYAKRQSKRGFAYPAEDSLYQDFCAKFPFDETPDQARAISEVLTDLKSTLPMDRVICGDVGFGKTEVALRAAFLVVAAKKQVAILVPTTLLAEQHYQTFLDRFSEFAVNIGVLSRFKSKKEHALTIAGLAAGSIDIVIGTHKLLQDNILFHDLGLLIIDEEHRFGVRQKEKLKVYRSEIDILTLTATPIPRTLNMALAKIRDLSIIASPPNRRLSIKTFVNEYSKALIKEAIQREIHRGGQVYVLHNAVDTINSMALELQTIVPEAKIAIAHGQMHERELENVMSAFYHRRYQVLLCTTIIETGIDIPSANTIIINRADKLGLAQLHQLRGRVGRSHHQAYAYCLIPPRKSLTSDALKRLDALTQLEDLGSGYLLASQDLEIRGAGELLGDTQSGDLKSIGFSLYMDLLDAAIKSLQNPKSAEFDGLPKANAEINLHLPAILPSTYIYDVNTRLMTYKKINLCRQHENLYQIKMELIDRFGSMPEYAHNLFSLNLIRISADKIGIKKIEYGPKGGRIEFLPSASINSQNLLKWIQHNPGLMQFEGPLKLKCLRGVLENDQRLKFISQFIEHIS